MRVAFVSSMPDISFRIYILFDIYACVFEGYLWGRAKKSRACGQCTVRRVVGGRASIYVIRTKSLQICAPRRERNFCREKNLCEREIETLILIIFDMRRGIENVLMHNMFSLDGAGIELICFYFFLVGDNFRTIHSHLFRKENK